MLRQLEHYTAPQGEGPKVGIMSQFVRFAGCNLKCPGWPCDTPHAIKPELFTKETRVRLWTEVSRDILRTCLNTGAENIVFTGGEPLLQNQTELVNIVDDLLESQPGIQFEIFTNGTRPIDERLINWCTFVMDWKLPGSGEDPNNPKRLENLKKLDGSQNSVKFVVANVDDLLMAQRLFFDHMSESALEVYVGAAWGKIDNEVIVNFVRDHHLPWRLNVQVHNYLFGAHRRFI
jgi:7-carboxy-7-deazaguanine synthase